MMKAKICHRIIDLLFCCLGRGNQLSHIFGQKAISILPVIKAEPSDTVAHKPAFGDQPKF